MAYMLYGNDIDDTTTPLEAGIGWTVKLAKPEFMGREAIVRLKARGLPRRLVGIELDGRRVARHGMSVESEGRTVGIVTSGTFSPSLQKPIGLAYVETALASPGSTLEIDAGGTRLAARVVRTPFWTRGSRK
jgi:aminomethyltransferase